MCLVAKKLLMQGYLLFGGQLGRIQALVNHPGLLKLLEVRDRLVEGLVWDGTGIIFTFWCIKLFFNGSKQRTGKGV